MGQSAAINGLPPLPPGATLNDAPSAGLPPLPPGATLNGSPTPPPPMPTMPAQQAIARSLAPQGTERQYNMHDPSGAVWPVGYHQVHKALDQGFLFSDRPTLKRYAQNHAADPLDENRVDQWIDKHPIMSGLIQGPIGFAKSAAQLLTPPGHTPPATRAETELQLFGATPNKGVREDIGGAAENAAEFMTGQELLGLIGRAGEAWTTAQKFKWATRLSELAQESSMLGKVLKIGMSMAKQGTVAAGQNYVRTGDVGSALTAGGITALTGGALESAGEGLSSAIQKRATTLENVGGVETPVPGELRNAKPTTQQTAGQEALKTSARKAAASHLAEVNESRAVPESAAALPARTGPFEFKMRGVPIQETEGKMVQSARKVPGRPAAFEPQFQTSSAPTREPLRAGDPTAPTATEGQMGADIRTAQTPAAKADITRTADLITQDPFVARAHLEQINQAIDDPAFSKRSPAQQQDILAARDDAQQQMARYHEEVLQTLPGYGKPNFAPVDIPRAVQKIGSWSDTGRAVKQTAVDGYKAIMDGLAFTGESPQHLTMIRQAYQTAEQNYMAAETPAAMQAAQQAIENTHQQLRDLLARVPNAASLKEFSGMNDAYRNGLGLEKIGSIIDRAFHAPMSSAKRNFEYTGFDGKQLQTGMETLFRTMGRDQVTRLMGKDNLDTVLQVAQLSSTIAGRAKIGAALKPITDSLIRMHVGPLAAGGYLGHFFGMPWEAGALAGWATSIGTKRVMNFVLTNPTIAKNLIFAIQSGARPENYGPFIATMIQKAVTDSTLERQHHEEERKTR